MLSLMSLIVNRSLSNVYNNICVFRFALIISAPRGSHFYFDLIGTLPDTALYHELAGLGINADLIVFCDFGKGQLAA